MPRPQRSTLFPYTTLFRSLYELMAGHDRFVADLRPLMQSIMAERGLDLSICCHPYDLCTELIARELGVIITDETGQQLNRSEEHTSELQSRQYLVCRLLLE